jgi:polyisoprenyl-phosphate glycosyltransferase
MATPRAKDTAGPVPAETVWLVSPVFFDVESYTRLRERASEELAKHSTPDVRFVAVDDTAGADPAIRQLEALPDQLVITPPFPLGHQRALVFGLRRLSTMLRETDAVVTLDADGEDQPQDLPRLLAALREEAGSLRTVVVAARTRRRESPSFKIMYMFFKAFFRLMSGTVIRSGNYAAYRGWLTLNVLFHPHFDLAYSSSLLALGLKVRRVPCERGVRFAGASKMTYLKLIQHGLRMLMPFADRLATRGLVFFASLLVLGLPVAAVLVGLRLSGHLLVEGWIIYAVCTALLLSALAAACTVIVFALFVQTQGLSLARLDVGLRVSEDRPEERAQAARR